MIQIKDVIVNIKNVCAIRKIDSSIVVTFLYDNNINIRYDDAYARDNDYDRLIALLCKPILVQKTFQNLSNYSII